MWRFTRQFAVAIACVLLLSDKVNASGWNDYELKIDPEYRIVRCNTLEVCLGRTNGGSLIYSPSQFAGTGPIVQYNVTPTHVFLHTLGRSPRNLFAGDTFENVDSTAEYFFILDKATDNLMGPMTAQEFSFHSLVKESDGMTWKVPANPHPEHARDGQVMFMGMTLLIFGLPVMLVSFPILVILFLRYRGRSNGYTRQS